MEAGSDGKDFLERKDFTEILGKTLRDFFDHPPEPAEVMNYGVRLSSGSTGSGILVGMHKTSAQIYRSAVTRNWYVGSNRVLCCFGPVTMRVFTVLDGQRFTEETLYLSLDVRDLVPGVEHLIADFSPQKVLGVPSYIAHIAPRMDTQTRLKVLSINVFGEFLTATTLSMLNEFFPNATVRSLFAVSEIGAVSTVSCDHQPLNFYHPRPGIEVAVYEPDAEGVGELLVSTLLNQTIPIERYKTGDSVRMHTDACQCGQTTTFEVLGRRGYDYLKVAGVTLRQEECERVAHMLRAYDDYRVEATSVQDGGHLKGKITLHAFRNDGVAGEELGREIGLNFSRALQLTPTRVLAELIEQQVFVPITVVFRDKPFPDANKNIKLIESV